MTVDEESPLLQNENPPIQETSLTLNELKQRTDYTNKLVVWSCFIDVISTWSSIASQFKRLSEGSWLIVAYNFSFCLALPVVSN
ncbi:hypothetical protein EYZ11_006114 [Aspergillus tanneri]|uniref:Uncharacterized protein n=1 Tax=Aspergillus tanneri TaxID=1220188 RepID=A0A4S3JIL1_9EURO|nr:hypothetical protein EYZ11_006114 [Aspergillus tanneri]